MKNISKIFLAIIISLLTLPIQNIAQKITRGSDVGEIYFLGLTNNDEGLYYSTNFGESAICVDNNTSLKTIVADKTKGYVYGVELPENLYFSNNYGYSNSWVFRNGEIPANIKSGVSQGFLNSGCVLHSEDYGVSFLNHSLNGFFGNPKYIAIDNILHNIAYVLTYKLNILDTIYLFKSCDNFENLNVVNKFPLPNGVSLILNRGSNSGEVFLFNKWSQVLYYSNNFAENFNKIAQYNFSENYYNLDFVGGCQAGEIYLLYNFANQLWLNVNTYIFHSTDYGKTFEVFHPFSKGNQPVLANFSSAQTEGTAPYTIEWCNFSIGENASYEWDFDNDGTIDSNEEKPVYIYEEPGIYSVKLSVVGSDSTNSFLKEDYITVYPFPAPPQDLTAEVVDDDVYLNWQAILLDTTLLGYNVYRDTTLLTPEPITSASYEDLNLPNGSYEYCVTAVYSYAVSEKTCVEASITVGIEEWEKAGLMIYPNPANENIHIKLKGIFQLSIFDSKGAQVFQQKVFNQYASISLGDKPAGIYFVFIKVEEKKIVRKILIR